MHYILIDYFLTGMKICHTIGDSPPFKKYGGHRFETTFPGCEIYVKNSDEYLACVARTFTSTIYHPVGTCKMGAPNDPTAVVDPQLRYIYFLFTYICTCFPNVFLQ